MPFAHVPDPEFVSPRLSVVAANDDLPCCNAAGVVKNVEVGAEIDAVVAALDQ